MTSLEMTGPGPSLQNAFESSAPCTMMIVDEAAARAQRGHQVDLSLILSDREKLGMDQVFVVWTSKSGTNQPKVV